MQNTKDSFYMTLRNRLAAVNPARVMTLRGVQRPGILTEEAEAVVPQIAPDVFVLRWTGMKLETLTPQTLLQIDCEIHYTTGGTQAIMGLDRGRALEAMDAELLLMLAPSRATKVDYSQTPAATMSTAIFWAAPVFGPVTTIRERLDRSVKVSVFSFLQGANQ